MIAYVINLESAVDRRRRMESLLNGLGVAFECVEAVLGSKLTRMDLRQFRHHEQMSLGAGEYGCLLSHVKSWMVFLKSNAPAAIILEDDLHFSQGFSKCIATLHVPSDEICLIRLETFLATVTVARQPLQKEKTYNVFRMLTPHGGTGAYVLNRITAEFLVRSYKQMRRAIDVELFSPERRSIPSITVYQVVPAPCAQDHILCRSSSQGFLRSGIIGDREDERFGLVGVPERRTMKLAKDVLRPIYTDLVSMRLSFRGQRRMKVRYG